MEQEEKKNWMMIQGIVGIFLHVAFSFWGAFVWWMLYGWFAVPAGAPTISYGIAYAGAFLLSFVRTSPVIEFRVHELWKKDQSAPAITIAIYLLFYNTFMLGIGFVLRLVIF